MQTEFRLFISSTFQDLQAERAYLLKHIFPKVRAACRERGIEFTDIDLRWGLTEEESSLGRVIRTCLEEIDRCRPYFIALLGDRYGWVPPLSEVQKDYQLIERYPWIEDAAIDGQSLVEIEIGAGFLRDPKSATGAFVYSRQSDAHQDDELKRLHAKIEASGHPVRTFTRLEELGEQVFADLTAVLDRDWPLTKDAATRDSELEAEHRLHENFAATRRRAYIADPEQTRALSEHVKSGNKPLVVYGESGAGKSALLAYFAFHYLRVNPQAFVITHFAGSSPSGSSGEAILRHILLEIRAQIGSNEALPSTRSDLAAALPNWLARVQSDLLIIIDAVNQLPDPDNLLGWLPEYLPPNVNLIVSTTPGASLDEIRSLNWSELEIGALGAKEREAIVVRFLGEYRKGLGRRQLEAIAKDPKASSPLFLRTLLEELRVAADFDLLEETIEHYLSATTLDDLFQFVLERMEDDYGHELVSSILSLIAASRRGLSEPELIELTDIDRTRLSVLLLALDYHLMKPNGRFTFFHDYLRRAVQRRYLANPLIERDRHRKLGAYFAKHGMISRRLDEEPWQWKESGDRARLLQSISDLSLLSQALKSHKEVELLQYWREQKCDPATILCAELAKRDRTAAGFVDVELDLAEFFELAGAYDAEEALARDALTILENEDNPVQRMRALHLLGSRLRISGDLSEAEGYLRQALELAEGQGNEESIALCASTLASALYLKSDYSEMEALVRRVLDRSGALQHIEARSLAISLGVALEGLGHYDEAVRLIRDAIEAIERHEGKTSEYALALNNLGSALYRHAQPGDTEEALRLFSEAAEINKRLLGPKHVYTLQNTTNLAIIMHVQGRLTEAEAVYLETIPLLEAVWGDKHPQAFSLRHNLALLRSDQGRYDEAQALFLELITRVETAYGPDHLSAVQFHLKLARNEFRAGRIEEARELYEKYLPMQEALLGKDHPQSSLLREEFSRAFPDLTGS